MKEFRKWLDKNHPHWKKFPCTTSTYKEGWRAALELVLNWLDYSTEHKEIKDRIHDELESE